MAIILLVENVEKEIFRHEVLLKSAYKPAQGVLLASSEARSCGLIVHSAITWRYLDLAEIENLKLGR